MPPSNGNDPSQPLRGSDNEVNRMYIPAVFKPAGTGAGHPKISGGITVDKTTGATAPRAFNRPDQRYNQPQSVIISNRQTRAVAEYAGSVILLGATGHYDIRAVTGNNYDVKASLVHCDCPDWLRMDESGYGILRCKHIYLVMLALADPANAAGLLWSTGRLAETLGIDVRTAEELCADGSVPATKKHNVWMIDFGDSAVVAAIAAYKHTIWPYV